MAHKPQDLPTVNTDFLEEYSSSPLSNRISSFKIHLAFLGDQILSRHSQPQSYISDTGSFSRISLESRYPLVLTNISYQSGYCSISAFYIVIFLLQLIIQLWRDTFRLNKYLALHLNFTINVSIHCCYMSDPVFTMMAEKNDLFFTYVHTQ